MASRCAQCNKSAYPLESLNVVNKLYHKRCFQCSVCRRALTLGGFDSYNQVLYCRTHKPIPQARGLGLSFQKSNSSTPQNTNIEQVLERRDQEQLAALFAPGSRLLDPNGSDFWSGKSFLRIVLDSNLPWAMHILLEAGADPNKRLTYSGTALHLIASSSSLKGETDPMLLQTLLEHGADPHLAGSLLSGSAEQTPLQMYFANPKFDPTSENYCNFGLNRTDPHTLLLILLRNHQPNKPNGAWGRSEIESTLSDLLHLARSPGEVDALVEAGALIHKKNNRSLSPLHSAATRAALKVLHHLLDLGADPFVTDCRGSTPIHSLVMCSNHNIYNLSTLNTLNAFLERCRQKGSLNVRDDRGRTPLFLASDERMINLLCQYDADINAVCDTETALTKAVRRQNGLIALALIKNMADIQLNDGAGSSPLHVACSAKNPDVHIIRALILAGADLWAKNTQDQIPSQTMDHVKYPVASSLLFKAERMAIAKDARKVFEDVRTSGEAGNCSLLYKFPKGIFERCVYYACEGQIAKVL